MKTIKALFVILFFSTFFIACEADAINDEVGVDDIETFGTDGQTSDEVEP